MALMPKGFGWKSRWKGKSAFPIKDFEYGLDKFTEKCIDRVNKFSQSLPNSPKAGAMDGLGEFYYTNNDINITSIWYFKKCHQNGLADKVSKTHALVPKVRNFAFRT